MILSIITSLDTALQYTGLVFLLGLAFHAGVLHNRVYKLERFVEVQLPAIFGDVKDTVKQLEKKIDKLTVMLYEHRAHDNCRLSEES